MQNTAALVNWATVIGLTVNNHKTKVMELLANNNWNDDVMFHGHIFEKVQRSGHYFMW